MKKDKALQETKARYRQVLVTGSLGRWVLGNILAGPCRFFGPPLDQETAVRQTVGKEILAVMDLWSGEGQSHKPENFVSRLARTIGEDKE